MSYGEELFVIWLLIHPGISKGYAYRHAGACRMR